MQKLAQEWAWWWPLLIWPTDMQQNAKIRSFSQTTFFENARWTVKALNCLQVWHPDRSLAWTWCKFWPTMSPDPIAPAAFAFWPSRPEPQNLGKYAVLHFARLDLLSSVSLSLSIDWPAASFDKWEVWLDLAKRCRQMIAPQLMTKETMWRLGIEQATSNQ